VTLTATLQVLPCAVVVTLTFDAGKGVVQLPKVEVQVAGSGQSELPAALVLSSWSKVVCSSEGISSCEQAIKQQQSVTARK